MNFLQLCQTVGADPWITIPTATTPTEMTEFIEYLSGTGSDPWSALRISRGQTAAVDRQCFGKIHMELGNETWNSGFQGRVDELGAQLR
jgi:alpha-L-arabinofuranosidase